MGKFYLKLRLSLVKLDLKKSMYKCITYVRNQMKIIIKIIFYNNLKENTESWVNLSEISGEVYCIRDSQNALFEITASIVNHSVQVNVSVGTIRRWNTIKHGNSIGHGKIDAHVVLIFFWDRYF